MDIEREKELHSQIESLRSQLEEEYETNTKLKEIIRLHVDPYNVPIELKEYILKFIK